LGLNWHDYHARNYDSALGRWMNVDPLGEKYFSWSPYNYVMNSPLRFTDPTGMFIEPPTKPGEIEGDVHFDDDTGASYEWDGEGGWHSDMQGIEELDEAYITNESPSAGESSSSGETENSSSDIFNTTIGALGFSTGIKNELVGFASKSGELSSGAMKYLKYSQGLGHGMTATNVIMSHIVYDKSNKQWGDKAKLGVSYTATTLTLFGKTAPIGIGIGIVDFSGGFDGFYNHLNQQEKLYQSTGGIMVPTSGVPIFINFKNN